MLYMTDITLPRGAVTWTDRRLVRAIIIDVQVFDYVIDLRSTSLPAFRISLCARHVQHPRISIPQGSAHQQQHAFVATPTVRVIVDIQVPNDKGVNMRAFQSQP